MEVFPQHQHLPKTNPKKSGSRFFLKIFGAITLIIVAVVLAVLSINGPYFYKQVDYWWKHDVKNETILDGHLPDISNSERDGSWLVIPKIGVDAPIVWVSSLEENDILAGLNDGVVHYSNTSLPGEIGNFALTGHSSNYWWINSKYNTVFALLEKLENGDEVTVFNGGQKYVYKVSNKSIVMPEQTDVLNPTSDPTLTLITCWPVGTSWKRLVISAKQISPEIKKEKAKTTPKSSPKTLPAR